MVKTQAQVQDGLVASRLLIARMPVSGVRTSCAKAASAVSTMPGAGAADLRLPRAFAAPPDTCFFAGRFFSGRVTRRERFFAVMIPDPCAASMARRRGQSHGDVFNNPQ